jgi:DNA-binding response OmpR family regulator
MKTHPTILLVDDDRSLRRYLQVILERADYVVLPAEDGLEAMKVALASSIDAVVTDAMMPNLGGHELCRFLRSHATLSTVPIIMLSGIKDEGASQEEQCADVYLDKPVSPEDLIECLGRLLTSTD